MKAELLEPILDRGIRNTNYFNGRLLSAEDLGTDQEATRQRQRQLGRAVGTGVVEGLDVRIAAGAAPAVGIAPVLSVSAGLALNRLGQALDLPEPATVPLVRAKEEAAAEAGLFAPCEGACGTDLLAGAGVYLLVIAPASGFEGRAPASGLMGAPPGAGRCGSRYAVEGVRFRLVELNLLGNTAIHDATRQSIRDLLTGSDVTTLSKLRNRLAHLCLGTRGLAQVSSDPFAVPDGAPAPGGLAVLERLCRPGTLTGCDVPLALLYWTADGIQFLDRWAVRRPLSGLPAAGRWTLLFDDTRLQAALLATLQFIEQTEDIVERMAANPGLANRGLDDFFVHLPPSGVVPVVGGSSQTGFVLDTFFGKRASGSPTELSTGDLVGLLRQALVQSPADVDQTDVLQLYRDAAHIAAVKAGETKQAYVVFTLRDLHGFVEADEVAKTLRAVWRTYARLIQEMVLLPKAINQESLPLWTALHTVQQEIVQYAMTGEAAAAARDLNRAAVIANFKTLYTMQKELVKTAGQTFEGDTEFPERQIFAGQLDQLLDSTLPDGAPGLKQSLQSGRIPPVVNAQKAINTLVGS